MAEECVIKDKKDNYEEKTIKDNEDEDLIERTKILLDQSIQLFNRRESDISALKSRIFTFFGIVLSLFSVQITLIKLLTDKGYVFSELCMFLLICFIVIIIFCIGFLIQLCRSNKYKDVKIFEDDAYNELITFNREELLSDFLYYYGVNYKFNIKQYSHDIELFNVAYIFFIIGSAIYAIFISLMWMG